MSTAGRSVWYLPFAVFATVLFLFTFAGLGYDRYIFTHTLDSNPEGLTTFLSLDTITALRDDARLHHALLGLTESIAKTSSDLGQNLDLDGLQGLGRALTEGVAELRKRYNVQSQKRDVLDGMGKAVEDLLGGAGVNTTGGLSAIVGNLGTALTEGLATPALFLGIGVGYVVSTCLLT